MMTSSGSTSSRIRVRSSVEVVPSTLRPYSSLIPCLRGSSSTKPTGRRRSCGLRASSRATRRPPSPPPTISTSRAPLPTRKLRTRPSTTRCTRNRAPSSSISISRKNSAITLAGSVTAVETTWKCCAGRRLRSGLDRVQQRDRADDHERCDDHALDDRLVVALTDEGPQPLVEPEGGEDDQRDRHHPRQASSSNRSS